ncbi:MAG: hypothetical protein HN352_10510 [Bacteroidetes bacterium]|nr:hypothetical protein [Bacteroidota bacterium]MBT4398483.1 hypothetical protein [Bacteroidota bacterium]MBT5427590.1 hypothetical protein [Bacteroidota bacterium]MBT7094241.1 hypothetical protein [Bacteroidota bacterium]MBT7464463.1 hypothetical protein [Bacteroidota bacterium]
MVFNRFLWLLILRISVIVATALAFSIILTIPDRPFTKAFFVLLIITEAVWLYLLVSRTNRELTRFLISLEENDTTRSLTKNRTDRLFSGLHESFERIMTKLFDLRELKEKQSQLYQSILKQTGSGYLLINPAGEIEISNQTATHLLGTGHLKTIDELEQIQAGSKEFIDKLVPGQSKVWNFFRHGKQYELLIHAARLKSGDTDFKLISIHNIQKQLSESAFKSHRNIIRILTHEINNTLTPITTLTDALIKNINHPDHEEVDWKDMTEGLDIIRDRSNSILMFLNNYRKLSHLPKPKIESVSVADLLESLIHVHQSNWMDKCIRVQTRISDTSPEFIDADREQLFQVLSNIIINAEEAITGEKNKEIEIDYYCNKENHAVISIQDYGPGIALEIREKLFIPFFSTKPSGSGIGLSLSHQIMQNHEGSIEVLSEPGKGTQILLVFKPFNACKKTEQINNPSDNTTNAN